MKSLYCPWLQDHWKLTLCSAIMAGSGYALYKTKWSQCKRMKTPTKMDNPYESIKLLNEYLAFNYGGPSVNCMFDGPDDGFNFPQRTAELCLEYYEPSESVPNRALDIGCAVGGASFTLASKFDDVIGIDYSHGFVKTCNALKETGSMEYDVIVEGELTTKHTATIPDHLRARGAHSNKETHATSPWTSVHSGVCWLLTSSADSPTQLTSLCD
uniref:Methyltransferase domain-containing protein n=1 Tax=Ciona savignyi TaxID=51511 RepID=H2YG64_CIOSA